MESQGEKITTSGTFYINKNVTQMENQDWKGLN